MTAPVFTHFDTAIGRCGIAWGERGIVRVQLPERGPNGAKTKLLGQFPDAVEGEPPAPVRRARDLVVALLKGEAPDLSGIPLDMSSVPAFHRRIYDALRLLAPGETLSYGALAAKAGQAKAARAVGQAMRRNPFPLIIPCHRVLGSGGRLGGYTADGGLATKLRLLSIEGAEPEKPRIHFKDDGRFGFEPEEAIRHLKAADPDLARLIDAVGPFRMQLKKAPSVFAALTEAIVYQQLHGKAAATIHARLCALFPRGRHGPSPKQLLAASDEALRGAGLSRAKLAALRDLARRAADGEIPGLAAVQTMDDDTVVERLSQVRGIGRWTAEMLLIFRLGRPDVLPVGDYGVRKGFAVAFRKRAMPSPDAVTKRGERWRPYRTVASWYLWRAAERAVQAERRKPT